MRVSADGPIQEHDRAALLCHFFYEQGVMDEAARQSIRRGDENSLKFALFGRIPHAIRRRPIEPCAAIPIIAV
jgi:hypothetical protein